MKKKFIIITIFFVLILLIIIKNFTYLNHYNTEFFHPLFGTLLPLAIFFFLSAFLKNVQSKPVFISVTIFLILDSIILYSIDTTCSQIVCFDRNLMALILSSAFSIIYFIVLLIKNKKQSSGISNRR